MNKKIFLGLFIILYLIPHTIAGNNTSENIKKPSLSSKKFSLLIIPPTDPSTNRKEKSEWFGSLTEQYLHFRLGASNAFNRISSDLVHEVLANQKKKSPLIKITFKDLAKKLKVTHILQPNYEIGRDGKKVYFYAELSSVLDSKKFSSFEIDFPLEKYTASIDSCVFWVFKSMDLEYNTDMLSRFYSIKILSSDVKDMKMIGQIILQQHLSPQKELNTSTKTLLTMVDNNPQNILAQYLAAKLLMFSSEYEKANKQLKNLLVIIPNYASLYADVSKNLRLSGKYNEALTYAANAEKKGIITNSLLLEGALSLESMQKYAKAEKAFKIILAKDSTETSALLFFVRQYNRTKNYHEAVAYANRVITIDPDNGQAYLEKGKALYKLKRYKEAEIVLTKSVDLIKNSSESISLIGDIYARQKQMSKAAEFYETALKSNSNDYKLLIQTVNTWVVNKNYKRALTLLQNAENIFPDSLILQKKMAQFYYAIGDTANALFYGEKYNNKNPKDTDVLLMLGDIYTKKGSYDKAFYMYNHARPLMADKTKVTESLAILYLQKGDTGASISLFREVLKKKPDYPNAQRLYADGWFNEGNYSTALKEYKKARYYEPKNIHIQKRIAYIYFLLKQYNAATRELIKYISLSKNDAEVYFYLAISQLMLKQIEKAEINLNKALKLGTPDSDILYHLGLGYAFIKKHNKSMEYYQKCIDLNPKHEEALFTLSDVYLNHNYKTKAAEIFLKIYDLDNDKYNEFLAKAGLLYEKDNKIETAYKLFNKFVKNGNKKSIINIHLARIEHTKRKYNEVIDLLSAIPNSEISENTDMLILAESYSKTEEPNSAIPWLKKIISENNRNIKALDMLAISYEKIKNFEEASVIYKQLIDITSDTAQANYSYKIATLYEKLDRVIDASEQYMRNIEKFKSDIRNYQNIIRIYLKSENWSAARKTLEKIVLLPDVKLEYRKSLAEVCLKQNDKLSAIQYLKKYLEYNTKDSEALFKLGNLYFDRGLFSKALPIYQKADKLTPRNYDILYKLAQACYKTRDLGQAVEIFTQVHKLDTNNIKILDYLTLCYRNLNNEEYLVKTLVKILALQPVNYSAKVELGSIYLKNNKINEAINILESAVKDKPDEVESRITLSGIYASLGNENARFSHLKQALSSNPKNADVHSLMGKFYLEKNEINTAENHIKQALGINREHSEALYSYSMCFFLKKDYNSALSYIKQVIEKESYDPLYLTLYARINQELGNEDIATKTIEDAIALDSTNIDILSSAGYIYKQLGNFERAKKNLLKAISLSDQCWRCYQYLGEISFDETDCSKASSFFRKALSINENNEEIMMKLGRTLVLSYDINGAKNIFEKVYINNPEHHEAYYRLIHINILLNKPDKVKILSKERKKKDKTVWDHIARAEIYESEGNYDAAFISYKVALRLQPDMLEAHAGNGRIDLINKKYNDAIVNFSKALVKDPYNPYLLLDLGKAYEGIGQYTSATDVFKEITNKYPSIPDSYYLMAGIKSKENKHGEAIDILKNGLKNSPNSPDLYYLLGQEYKVTGQFDQSISAYKNAVKNGNEDYLEAYLEIANIYKDKLNNEGETKKYIKKYLKKGGDRDKIMLSH
ncbi:MAG: tetratricopeptide repeat protein [Chitinispirillia bacterium]